MNERESSGLFRVASGRFLVFIVMQAGSAGARAGGPDGRPRLSATGTANDIGMGRSRV
jgi:hypothetical protein